MLHILRLGHRPFRDQRITTHVCLAARSFGADKIIYSGEKDSKLEEGIRKIVQNWGGKFDISYEKNWKRVIEDHKKNKFSIIHLTMYGLAVQKQITKIRKNKKILIIVGGEKVPGEVYQLADYNISVTSQPHSEVSGLAILLHEFWKGKELDRRFPNARIRLTPAERGKNIKNK
ncbi:MAG: tRNA (cytidine(56)-2'-O)-methyltransferase [Candidatus Aenigmatarchaeota archaeon]